MLHVMCHVSCVTCHVSNVTCIIIIFFIFFTNWWSLSVEGLLSTGPTPSSLLYFIVFVWLAQLHNLPNCYLQPSHLYLRGSKSQWSNVHSSPLRLVQITDCPRHSNQSTRSYLGFQETAYTIWSPLAFTMWRWNNKSDGVTLETQLQLTIKI